MRKLGATINIDTGGTFTDGYFTRGDRSERVKVDTTPHDLTECLGHCLKRGAAELGYADLEALLGDTDVFRFSSTLGTNSIIQRTGPRIGLLVGAGEARGLYGDGDSPLYEVFLRPDMVAEVADPFDEEEVRGHVRRLLVAGARIVVASLPGSEDDPSGEQAIKKLLAREYPRHYLGSVPCLLASEVTPWPDAKRRTATAVINAYLHPDMVRTLYKADEDSRRAGYPHPMLVVHASGGVARVAKTRAIETYNSGPAAGVFGAARMATHYGLEHVVTMDVGGTSTDLSIISGRRVPFELEPTVGGVPVFTPTVRVGAIGGGGGSLGHRNGSEYSIGPDSAGAAPGPACYGLGGTQATGTDGEVVLGHLDPGWFLGGRRTLDADRARAACERLGGDDPPERAAWGMHRALVSGAAARIDEMLADAGIAAKDCALFAFGGGGGLYGVEVARELGIDSVYSFADSSVFAAVGVGSMDLGHVYEIRPDETFTERLGELMARARLDAEGEGIAPEELSFRLQIDSAQGTRSVEIDPKSPSIDRSLLGAGTDRMRLHATVPSPQAPIAKLDRPPGEPSDAAKGSRELERPDTRLSATVYDRSKLGPGHRLNGPALVEVADTTILVPDGARLSIDEYGTAIIEVANG